MHFPDLFTWLFTWLERSGVTPYALPALSIIVLVLMIEGGLKKIGGRKRWP